VEKMMNISLKITEEELGKIYLAPVHSKAKAEAL